MIRAGSPPRGRDPAPSIEEQAVDDLVQIGAEIRDEFEAKRRVLSFEEYFELVAQTPECHLRDAASYARDCFDHFGTYEVRRAGVPMTRYRLFDCEFAGGQDRLAGHEAVQQAIYRVLDGFVRQGRPNKLILLHGPNGSAKSTCVAAIARALSHYSLLEGGALYRFNWVFPAGMHTKGRIGFTDRGTNKRLESFAHLPEEMVDARLTDELRDHPLLLVPKHRRGDLLAGILPPGRPRDKLPHLLRYGHLSHRNQMIFEALLSLYHGDYHAVLGHVQVERFFLSRRYRTGIITVEPKLSVDAHTRQLTMDRSLEALPPALQTLSLFRHSGDLVDANRGIIEFTDLLKRPIEAFKYLINTVEQGQVSLDNTILYLDELFIGSTNDLHLRAFRQTAEFLSFKGRIELVQVGYLRDYLAEREIYEAQLADADIHVAPHAVELAALWAVLTRLSKPDPERHPESIRELIAELSPIDKAVLYAEERVPPGIEEDRARLLRQAVGTLTEQHSHTDAYEGHVGASPREIKMVLLGAAQDRRRGFLSPLAVIDEIRALCRKKDVYPYLQREALPGGYEDPEQAVEMITDYYHERLQETLWDAVGIVPRAQIDEMLERYIDHVSHWVKKEKLRNPITGNLEEPDVGLLGEFEGYLDVDKPESFRRDAIARIASWAMEHGGERPRLQQIFAKEHRQLTRAIFGEREKLLRETLEDVLVEIARRQPAPEKEPADEAAEGDGAAAAGREQVLDEESISDARREAVDETLRRLIDEYGYNLDSATEAIRLFLNRKLA